MDSEGAPDPAEQGRVVLDGDVDVLRFERVFSATPAEVWNAVTDPDATAAWAYRSTFEGGAGGTVTFDLGEMGPLTGELLAWEERSLLEYAWEAPEGRWHVRLDIEEAGDSGGSVLEFTHLSPDPHNPDFAAGWHWHLDRLAVLLAGETPPDVFSDQGFEDLQRLYSRAEG